jgi:hypothetical protein
MAAAEAASQIVFQHTSCDDLSNNDLQLLEYPGDEHGSNQFSN